VLERQNMKTKYCIASKLEGWIESFWWRRHVSMAVDVEIGSEIRAAQDQTLQNKCHET
jgi:hypothetical protein